MGCSMPVFPVHHHFHACSNSCPLSQWCHPNILSSVIPFSLYLQSFPASGSFPMSQFFASGGESIGTSASASVLSTNAAAAKSLQSCLALCNPIDVSPPGSPVPGILQARTLEWVAISFSNAWKWKVKVKSLSRVRLLVTPWTAAYQAPLPMGFSRQEYWSGLPLPSLIWYFAMNIQDWFSLGLTGFISLQLKRLWSLLQHHSSKASVLHAQLS